MKTGVEMLPVEQRAWEMLCKRLQRDPATSEEGDTCSLRAAWKAMLAFADHTHPAATGSVREAAQALADALAIPERGARNAAILRWASAHGHTLAIPPASDAAVPAGEEWSAIQRLRDEEADSVTVLCDNPDGPPNAAVECCGFWTGFAERRFEGDTIRAALQAAVAAKNEAARVGYPDLAAAPKVASDTEAAASEAAVPAGFVLVPVEPSEVMREAGEVASWDDGNHMPAINLVRSVWSAMLAVAPTPDAAASDAAVPAEAPCSIREFYGLPPMTGDDVVPPGWAHDQERNDAAIDRQFDQDAAPDVGSEITRRLKLQEWGTDVWGELAALHEIAEAQTEYAFCRADAIRAVTTEMRRFMPNACGDWADKIDTILRHQENNR